jgi:hypothetical protein
MRARPLADGCGNSRGPDLRGGDNHTLMLNESLMSRKHTRCESTPMTVTCVIRYESILSARRWRYGKLGTHHPRCGAVLSGHFLPYEAHEQWAGA